MKLIDNTGLSYLIGKIKTMIGLKADKTYVDNKVKTNVPAGAVFTDTVYSHPATHPASMITDLPAGVHVINTFAEFKALWEDESAFLKYAVVANQLTIDATETIAAYGELRILSDLKFSLSANNLSLTLAGVETFPALKVYEAFTVSSPAAYVFSIDCGDTMGMIYAGSFRAIRTNVTIADFIYQVKEQFSGGTISGGGKRNWKAGFADVTTVSAGFMSAADKTALNGKQDQSIIDAGGYYPTDTVETALQQIGAELDGLAEALEALL